MLHITLQHNKGPIRLHPRPSTDRYPLLPTDALHALKERCQRHALADRRPARNELAHRVRAAFDCIVVQPKQLHLDVDTRRPHGRRAVPR